MSDFEGVAGNQESPKLVEIFCQPYNYTFDSSLKPLHFNSVENLRNPRGSYAELQLVQKVSPHLACVLAPLDVQPSPVLCLEC